MNNNDEQTKKLQPLHRPEGVTLAERYLKSLCEKSFLTLWSYAGVYRDEGKNGDASHGKEVCDLLVVFENHIIIFSDKDCRFPDTGDLQLDWNRWFRRGILKSADQIWGAEKWIKEHPDRLFLDRACTQNMPVGLPEASTAIFHRVVVAHASSARCREELKGSGSLAIIPDTVSDGGGAPFIIGQINPSKGFVHILDDTSLGIVMGMLDTITDFITYLSEKEKFITSGRFMSADGEEELLAAYLQTMDEQEQHVFTLAKGVKRVAFARGLWERFTVGPQRQAQVKANKVSYGWDALIETFNENIVKNSLYYTTHSELAVQEKLMRFLAREPRLRRRMLARAFLDIIRKTLKGQRATRVLAPSFPGDPYFVLLVFPTRDDIADEVYRNARGNFLIANCKALKVISPDAEHIVGIATEPGLSEGRSEDLVYLDATNWTAQDQEDAKRIRNQLGLFKDIKVARGTEWEFPIDNILLSDADMVSLGNNPRNKLCPCGSGRKYKRCHGR